MKTVKLEWRGPLELTGDLAEVFAGAGGLGVYGFTGRHYAYDSELLLYLGKTETSFFNRIWQEPANRAWVVRMSQHLGARFWYAPMLDTELVKGVETALIHVHQPPYNSAEIVTPGKLDEHLTVYNMGRLPPHLLPIVATDYPWFGNPQAFRVSGT